MEFKALRIPTLTKEIAEQVETSLYALPGIKHVIITLETQELYIAFDENQIGIRTVINEMTQAGCPLWNISAALFK